MYDRTSTASDPLKAFLYVNSFFVRSPTMIFLRKHSPTRDRRAGYTRGGRILVAVGGRSLSIDLLLVGRCASVDASDSEGVMVGAMVEAIDIVLP